MCWSGQEVGVWSKQLKALSPECFEDEMLYRPVLEASVSSLEEHCVSLKAMHDAREAALNAVRSGVKGASRKKGKAAVASPRGALVGLSPASAEAA